MSKLFNSAKGWFKSFKRPDYEQDGDWKSASKWSAAMLPGDDVDCDLLLTYARFKYDETLQIYDRIDDKADAVYRFSAALVGALFALQKTFGVPVDCFTAVPYLLFLVSVGIAMYVRWPMKSCSPTPVRFFVDTPHPSATTAMQLAVSYHIAITGTAIASRWKSKTLNIANAIFTLGLVSLPAALYLSSLLTALC